MKSLLLLIFLSWLLFPDCEKSDNDRKIIKMSSVRGYRNWTIGSFRCGLFVPENYDSNKAYPLIIFLHGWTDTTTWDLGWYNEPVVTNDPCIVLTPKCPVEEEYGWGNSYDPRVSPMMARTFEMVEMAEKAFHLDTCRYYIYGSSMGGHGTYGAIQKNPGMFAAGYVECGSGNIEMAPQLAEMPLWIFHGSEDNVVPVQPARDLYQAILQNGGKQIRYTEYPMVRHNVWDYTRNETTLPAWLLAQRKGSVHRDPNVVQGFSGEMTEDRKVILHWEVPEEETPVSDDNIWYCRIYRNGRPIAEVYNNSQNYMDTTLYPHNTYRYQISTVNYFFRESALSDSVSAVVKE